MFSISETNKPQILAVEKDFLIVYKPPRLHSAPLAKSHGENIFHWCFGEFPEIAALPGRKEGEGGLLHRLDYETQGLMLLARNRQGMEALLTQQDEGKIQKEYSALAAKNEIMLPGFPAEKPVFEDLPRRQGFIGEIQSAFRAFGPGRKAVRPVLIDNADGGKRGEIYSTEILDSGPASTNEISSFTVFRLGICKGFRHQIRAHLAWLGMPILNDNLYGGISFGGGLLALRACSIEFADPSTSETRSYSIPQLEMV